MARPFWRCTAGMGLAAGLLWLGAALFTPAAAAPAAGSVAYKAVLLVPEDDARLARNRLERAYLGHPAGPASDGVAVALKEAALELEGVGARLSIDTVPVADAAAAGRAMQAAAQAGALAVLADLPADWLLAASAAAPPLPLINLSAGDDRLREQDCRAHLLHIAPSERMRADALAQTLVSRQWASVLLLVGPTPQDALRGDVAQAALARYGLKLSARKAFKLSADPRERQLANPLLLTAGGHEAVWVVDSDGEFARSLPYRTATPRPVLGDAGLVALSWHGQFERFGAPQVSRRLAKGAGRPIAAADWQAWLGAKALVTAVVVAHQAKPAPQAKAGPGLPAVRLALQAAELDGSKGVPLSFRAWDGQLRQPLLLTDGQGVIASAPVDGILHPRDSLDTLGADAPEKRCKR